MALWMLWGDKFSVLLLLFFCVPMILYLTGLRQGAQMAFAPTKYILPLILCLLGDTQMQFPAQVLALPGSLLWLVP